MKGQFFVSVGKPAGATATATRTPSTGTPATANSGLYATTSSYGALPGTREAESEVAWLPIECIVNADEPCLIATRIVAQSSARITYINHNPLYLEGPSRRQNRTWTVQIRK